MITLKINGVVISVPAGTTILAAAGEAAIFIPTLCYYEGSPHYTSCMLCIVEEKKSGKLLPACSARAADGMVIETENETVRNARRETLELLLSEHAGDCLPPCRRACPAHFDIPLMLSQIAGNAPEQAWQIIQERIPFPATLGRICPAPCEKVCRRRAFDQPVAICSLKQLAGDYMLEQPAPSFPAPARKQKIAIVGAGAAGLSAAFYLTKLGYPCTVFDKQDKPGGKLYSSVPAGKLDPGILQREIAAYLPHVEFRMKITIGKDLSLAMLRSDYSAVILTPGELNHRTASFFPVAFSSYGITVTPPGSVPGYRGLFAGGAAVKPTKLAVSAVAHGRHIAREVREYLSGPEAETHTDEFLSVLGTFSESETAELVQGAAGYDRIVPAGGNTLTPEEGRREAGRCLHCECYKVLSCALRKYSLVYKAGQHAFSPTTRPQVVRRRLPGGIVYEEGKCIRCGICVRITASSGQGMTFLHRGYNVRVDTPFISLSEDIWEKYGTLCASACPTGAISLPGVISVKAGEGGKIENG